MSQPNGAKRASHNNKVGAGDVGVSQQSVASSPLNLGHTSNLAKCKHLLLEKLEALKAKQLLNHSLKMQTTEFQLLEFYGDSYLYERVSNNLMLTKRFMSPHLLTTCRTYIIKNANLALAFDSLGLDELFPKSAFKDLENSDPRKFDALKSRADVVEAIIGELAQSSEKDDSIEMILKELISYIFYLGEGAYHQDMANVNQPIEPHQPARGGAHNALPPPPPSALTSGSNGTSVISMETVLAGAKSTKTKGNAGPARPQTASTSNTKPTTPIASAPLIKSDENAAGVGARVITTSSTTITTTKLQKVKKIKKQKDASPTFKALRISGGVPAPEASSPLTEAKIKKEKRPAVAPSVLFNIHQLNNISVTAYPVTSTSINSSGSEVVIANRRVRTFAPTVSKR